MKFELNNLPRNCSNEDVLAEIKRVDALVGKDKLTQADYEKYAKMGADGVKLRFGNWEKALTAAGLCHKYFGTKITLKMRSQKAQYLTDKEILDELKRVAESLGKEILTRIDFNRNSEISSDVFVSRFGSWNNALKKAGLDHKYSGVIITENRRLHPAKSLTNDDVLKELQRIAKLLTKETVSIEDVRNHSTIMHPGIVSSRFGSWITGMEKAGLKVSKMYKRAYSDEEYFENLLNVWVEHGRQPISREMDAAPSKISSAGYKGHFGSWRKALEAFVVRMNQDEQKVVQAFKEGVQEKNQEISKSPEIIKIEPRVLVENRRDIGLGLRYKVLSRDKFKCVRCGSSPATNHSCRLHIDHVIPFSKGGRTVLENLQTLCEMCNLGKGNRHSE